jgi:hypothetical protein
VGVRVRGVLYLFARSRVYDLYSDRHGIINYIDTKAKCRHLKKLTCKGTLRQEFIRVYRLEIQSVMLVFSTQLCEMLPHSPSLWLVQLSPHSPFLHVNKYIVYTYTVCKG